MQWLRWCLIVWVFLNVLWWGVVGAAAEARVDWHLTNPFRLFQGPEMTQFHQILNQQLTEEEQALPILSVERRLSAHLPRGWAETLFEKTCWSRKSGRYSACVDASSYLRPKSHEIKSWLRDLPSGALEGETCTWSLMDRTGGKKLAEFREPCRERVSFRVPYPKGGKLRVVSSDGQVFEQRIRVRDLFIVGLGDSFASGEGNPDVPVKLSGERHVFYGDNSSVDYFSKRGYPTRVGAWGRIGDAGFMAEKALWSSQSCHRSLYSHQLRAALQLAIERPKRAVTFVSFSCAGAEVTHGLFRRFKGNEWSLAPPAYGQISDAALAQCGGHAAKRQRYSRAFGLNGRLEDLHDLDVFRCPREKARKIDLLMLSIGGNDVGFSSLVANVVVKDTIKLKTIGGWMGHILNASQARGKFGDLKLRYKALKRALHVVLHIPWKEADRVLLTAYPNMSFRDEGRRVCASGAGGMDVAPLFSLSHVKATEAEQFADQLNKMMAVEARRYNWTYIQGHRPLFLDHGICATREDSAVNWAENLSMPFFINGRWEPFKPTDYKPYAARSRWFRTPNDAYLTGHLHISGPVIRNLSKIKGLNRLQVLIAGTYSGAFHPTAEGQAVIADHLKRAAEKVLEKYGQ